MEDFLRTQRLRDLLMWPNGIIFPNLEFLWLTRGPISLPKRYLFGWGGTVVHFGSFWISITSSTILYARWYIYLSLFTFLSLISTHPHFYISTCLHTFRSTYISDLFVYIPRIYQPTYMFQVPGPPPTPPAMVMVITHQPPFPLWNGWVLGRGGGHPTRTNRNATGRIRWRKLVSSKRSMYVEISYKTVS